MIKQDVKRKKIVTTLASVIITVLLVAILLTQINLGDITTALTSIDPIYIIIGFIFYLCSYIFRALRFYILLNKQISVKALFSIVCLHNLANNILPARTGEISYVYLSKKIHGIPVGEGVASLMVARVFDFITISFLFFVAAISVKDLPDMISKVILMIMGFLIFIVLLMIGLIYRSKEFIDRIRGIFGRWVEHRVVAYILRKGNETAEGIEDYRSLKVLFLIFLISILPWCFLFLITCILLNGMGIQITIWEVILGSTFVQLTTNILPIHGVGGFGTKEVIWTVAYMSLGLSKEMAILSGFSIHLIIYIYFLILGCYGLWIAKYSKEIEWNIR